MRICLNGDVDRHTSLNQYRYTSLFPYFIGPESLECYRLPRTLTQMQKRNQHHRSRSTPLSDKDVAAFFDALYAGDVSLIKEQLSCTPRLSNARKSGITPLMACVSADKLYTSLETQIELIDLLMRNNASLAARNDNRMHAMLYACWQGAPFNVIQRLMYWNDRRGGNVFRWSHCDTDKNGALVLAVNSGSIRLVKQLLSIPACCDDDSNNPIKVLRAAINSGNEQLVLLILNHFKTKSIEITDFTMYLSDGDDDYDNYDDYDDCYTQQSAYVTLKVADCVESAFQNRMFKTIEILPYLNDGVPQTIWQHCQRAKQAKNPMDELPASVVTIAKRFFVDEILKENPTLLPLLIGRLQTLKSPKAPNGGQCLLVVEPDIFKCIISCAFNLDPVDFERNLHRRRYFESNSVFCNNCEEIVLPGYCDCYSGYSTLND